jgi:nitroreductase
MKFIDLVQSRQSNRRYEEKPVEREKIERCIEAARLAPSACNSQPWKFIIVDEPELRAKVARETYNNVAPFNKFALQAPVVIVIVMEKPTVISQIGGRIKSRDFFLYDIGITAEHFCLQAAEEGIGTCMIGWFNEKPLKQLLKIPAKREVGLIITLGYPADKQRIKIRKTTDKICSYNSY